MNSSYELVKTLSAAMVNVPETDNVSTNRKLWDTYAREWNKKSQVGSSSSSSSSSADTTPSTLTNKPIDNNSSIQWLQNMSEAVGIPTLDNLTILGNEWSDQKSLDEVLQNWLLPMMMEVKERSTKYRTTTVTTNTVPTDATVTDGTEENDTLNASVSPIALPVLLDSSTRLSSFSSSTLSSSSPSESFFLRTAEIGSGGGRVSKYAIKYSQYYHCFDISHEMLKQCQKTIVQEYGPTLNQTKVKYYLLDTNDGEVYWPCIETVDPVYKQRFNNLSNKKKNSVPNTGSLFDILQNTMQTSSSPSSSSIEPSSTYIPIEPLISSISLPLYDIIICFDVLVHCDMHAIYTTLRAIRLMLQPYGKAFISTSNLLAPLGWERFQRQRKDTPAGFFWTVPEAIDNLIYRSGLRIVRKSWPPLPSEGPVNGLRNNVYYDRDYLLELEINPVEGNK